MVQLGLEELRKRAEDDIVSKLTTENILSEVFSPFAATYDCLSQPLFPAAYCALQIRFDSPVGD